MRATMGIDDRRALREGCGRVGRRPLSITAAGFCCSLAFMRGGGSREKRARMNYVYCCVCGRQ